LSGFESQTELQGVKSDSLKIKSDLEFQMMASGRKLEELATVSGDLKVELSDARLEVSNQSNQINQLLDPDKKAAAAFALKQKNFVVDKILEKIRLKGPAVVLEVQRDIRKMQFELDDITELLADIEVLMPTLPVSL
jgi:hypothetical protein